MSASETGLGDQPPHLSVLYNEIILALNPSKEGLYIDGTLGAGGHAHGILGASEPSGMLLGLDTDPHAIEIARIRLECFGNRVSIRKASYTQATEIAQAIGWQKVDGIVLDLGVSSMQIDQPERGFSFKKDGALDMRFDPTKGATAADLVNTLTEVQLADIFWRYGEERYSRRIAVEIIKNRPIHKTEELANLIRKTIGNRKGKIDPATRTFQALRIAVNNELKNLEDALPNLVSLLKPSGRLAVISFHSLEDRIVKAYFMKESKDCICPTEQMMCTCGHQATIKRVTIHPVTASAEEVSANPRARSAKLRVAERLEPKN